MLDFRSRSRYMIASIPLFAASDLRKIFIFLQNDILDDNTDAYYILNSERHFR